MFNFVISGGNEGAVINIEALSTGEIYLAKLNLTLASEAVPEKIKIDFKFPIDNCYSTWAPLIGSDRKLAPNWGKKSTKSRLASGMPIHQILSIDDKNRMCIALSDTATPTAIATGVCEEDAHFDCVIELFTNLTAPIKEYSTLIRIDTRSVPFYDAVYDVSEWWEKECGCTPSHVPAAARMPVDSLWYSFHQQLDAEAIVKECELSKSFGMDTVIIDDGWQTDDNNRGYAYCGDWKVAPKKMGDMKQLVDRLHAIGMNVMLWYSVPFVGKFSDKYEEFKDMLLGGWGDAFMLDPRYKKVRDYLVSVYTAAVSEWGLDGLKLDFIDSFELSEQSVKPDPRRDYASLEEAVDVLMTEVNNSLTAINPDILIEFRQSYVGPYIRKYGNMLRVYDCPNDAVINRRNIVDMRLTSGKTPVHSDMLMWNVDEPVKCAAVQLASVLYSVPQISVKIDRLNDEHKKMLKFYLDFWRKNSTVLLDGKITACDAATCYSQVSALLGDREIITAYTSPIINPKAENVTVVNSTRNEAIILKGCDGKQYTVVDCMGNTLTSGRVEGNLFEVAVPLAGMVTAQ